MATVNVIDSLIIQLGIDASKFTAGQKAAVAALKATAEAARQRGKEIEDSGRRTSEFFSRLRGEAVSLVAAMAGARGIKDFVANINKADDATGRLSRNIGANVEEISKWEGVVRLAGGTAEDARNTMKSLSDTFKGWGSGIPSEVIADLRAISNAGQVPIPLKPGTEMLLALSENLKNISKRDPGQAGLLGSRLPFMTPHLFDELVKGRVEVEKTLKVVERIGVATKVNTDAAREFARTWEGFSLSIEATYRRVQNFILPLLSRMFSSWTEDFSDVSGSERRDKKREIALGGRIPIKAGAGAGGSASIGIIALANTIRRDIKEITALNDGSAAHRGAAHGQGLAMDFSVHGGKAEAAEVAARLRARAGAGAYVKDEYNFPSPGSTGPHIHVQFNSPEAANRFARSAGGGGAYQRVGNETNVDTKIDTVNVYTSATDGKGIAKDFTAAVRIHQGFSSLSNSGQQ